MGGFLWGLVVAMVVDWVLVKLVFGVAADDADQSVWLEVGAADVREVLDLCSCGCECTSSQVISSRRSTRWLMFQSSTRGRGRPLTSTPRRGYR